MKILSFLLVLVLVTSAQAQSCYSGVSAPLTTNYCSGVQTTTHVVQVPVQVQVHTVAVPQAVALPQAYAAPQCGQSFGFSQGYQQSFGVPLSVPYASPVVGFNTGFSLGGVGYNAGVVNRSFVNVNRFSGVNQGFVGVNRFSTIGGAGVSANFVDRKGNSVQAVGANRVDVKRGLFGNIKSVTTDQRPGLRLPF